MFPDRNEALKKIFARSLRLQPMSASFLHPDLHRQVRLHMTPCRQSTTRSTMLWLWNCGCLAERMEAWAAHGALRGISYAYPMLDRRLLDFVAGLPPEQFVRGPWTRWLMRNTMQGILPAEVCWQPDKAEPMRFDTGFKAARQVVVMARERLSAAQWPSRARYLDMPRLLARMSPEQMNESFRPGDILRALQFLDF